MESYFVRHLHRRKFPPTKRAETRTLRVVTIINVSIYTQETAVAIQSGGEQTNQEGRSWPWHLSLSPLRRHKMNFIAQVEEHLRDLGTEARKNHPGRCSVIEHWRRRRCPQVVPGLCQI